MRCLVFSISFEVQCWHDVLTRRTRWSNNLNTCVDIVWILHGFRTRARHTRTLHAHVIRTLHAHATRALLKHPPYSLSAAPSGQPEAGRAAVDPSHTMHTHTMHTHETKRTHARCVCMYMFTHFSFDRSVPARIFKIHSNKAIQRCPQIKPRLLILLVGASSCWPGWPACRTCPVSSPSSTSARDTASRAMGHAQAGGRDEQGGHATHARM